MATMGRCYIVFIAFVSFLNGVLAARAEIDVGDVLNELRHRIESLETRDAAKDAKIAELESEISDLKSKMEDMGLEHKKKEDIMQDQIKELVKTIEQTTEKSEDDHHIIHGDSDIMDRRKSTPSAINQKRVNVRSYRAVPEHEVAFYATHTDHDVHHVGLHQVLLFQSVVTNNGNAYSNTTGAFTAPVDGTYVIHVTVMGLDTTGHVHAHIEIDGASYSTLYVTAYDQSSQLLVINLTAGQAVTVRNDVNDTGFVGQHYSTFSGFLLYEQYQPNVVG